LAWEDDKEAVLAPEQQPFPAALQHSQHSSKAWSGQLRQEHALAVQNVASLCLRDL